MASLQTILTGEMSFYNNSRHFTFSACNKMGFCDRPIIAYIYYTTGILLISD